MTPPLRAALLVASFAMVASAAAETPLDHREPRATVTLEFLMESCAVIGETAYGMIPHFDCESFLSGVIDAQVAIDAAPGADRRACVPPALNPRQLYSLIDEHAIPRDRWNGPAAPLLVGLLERAYPCGGTPALAPGEHAFVNCYAEHPLMPCPPVVAVFDGTRLRIEDRRRPDDHPEDRVLADGELAWHAGARRWIIADDPADVAAPEVGGCTDGPPTVDLALREFQDC